MRDTIDDRWPDAEQRAERRARLHEKIDAYLDAFIEPLDGGWAQAEREHVQGLYDLFGEIVDLKFQRDEDGDQVIEIALANRRMGRMVWTVIPADPEYDRQNEDLRPEDKIQWIRDVVRAAEYLSASADSARRMIDNTLSEVAKSISAPVRLQEAIDKAIADINAVATWQDAMTVTEEFRKLWNAEKAYAKVCEAFMERYGDDPDFVAPREDIDALITFGRIEDARTLWSEYRRTYGLGLRPSTDKLNAAIREQQRVKAERIRVEAREKAARVAFATKDN